MHFFSKNKIVVISSIGAMLLLTACSGGETEITTASVTGIASKGIIINGNVEAFKIENGLIDRTPIATGITDDSGEYKLNITEYSGPLHIVVSAGSNSKMKCDAISGCARENDVTAVFGKTIKMPSNLKMGTVIPSIRGGLVKGNINPLTHMAAALAKSTGLGKTGIETANAKVEALFDIENLLGAEVVDITDADSVRSAGAADADALKIAYFSSAFAEVAIEEGEDINTVLNILTNNYVSNNGQLVKNDNGFNDANTIAFAEITQAVVNTLKSDKTTENVILDAGITSEITALNTDAEEAPPGTNTETTVEIINADLDAAKNIVKTVTTWSTQLTTLKNKGELFAEELEMTESASEIAFEAVGNGLYYASIAAGEAFDLTQHRSSVLYAILAGKTISYGEGNSMSFDCEGGVQGTVGIGEFYLSNLTAYVDLTTSSDEDIRAVNFTFPSATVAAETSITVTTKSDNKGIEVNNRSIASIEPNETNNICELTAPTNLSDYVDGDFVGTGTVIVDGNTVKVAGSITNGINKSLIDMTYTLPNYMGNTFAATIAGSIETEDKAKLMIANTSRASVVFPASFTLVDEVNAAPLPSTAEFKLDLTLEQGRLNDFGGEIIAPITFNGAMDFSLVRTSVPESGDINDLDEKNINPANLTMSGEFSNTKNRFSAELTATMKNANSFSWINADASEIIQNDLGRYTFSNDGNTLTVTFPKNIYTYEFEEGTITITDKGRGDNDYQYSYGAGSGYNDLNQFLSPPNYWFNWQYVSSLDGEYQVTIPSTFNSAGGNLSGKMVGQSIEGETKSNWRDLGITLTMDANFDELQPAKLTLHADRSNYAAGTASATFAYKDVTLTLSLVLSSDGISEEVDASLVVTDSSGSSPVRLTIFTDLESDDVNGSIVINGAVVGNITSGEFDGQLIVNYIDGTFSSILF